jgi:L-iditol 2-dehydrogenase
MQGLVNFAPEPGSVELRELPIPEIGRDDVLLEVKAVGVCGSDLHMMFGTPSWPINFPVVLGHEFGGIVAKAGEGVKSFKVGDRVVSETAAVIDTSAPFYRAGQYNIDPNRSGFGSGVDGAMCQFVCVPERCLHHVPDGLAFEIAALTEPCCVAYNATCVQSTIRPGDLVAVIGPGPIGLLCAMMAKLAGADPLLVVGTPVDAKRLNVARRIGASHAIGAGSERVQDVVKGLTDGYGCDLVIDAAGVSATLQLAIDIVRPGGQITKVGWGPTPYGASLDPLVMKAVKLQGSFSHNWPMWEKVLRMLASGQLDLSQILNLVTPLENWRTAFDAMHSGDIVKAVLVP